MDIGKTFRGALALFLAVAAAATASAATRTEALRRKLASGDRKYVFAAMHRGDWRNFPENSRDAILSSIAIGADIVELDVRMTKDGRFVLMHDPNVARVTDGKGKVSELTLDEVRKLHMTKDGKKTDYKVLTLEEALDLTRGKILMNIDKFTEHPREILDAVDAAGAIEEVLVKSTLPVRKAKELFGPYWKKVESGELLYMPVVQFCWGREAHAAKILPQYLAEEPRRNSMYELCFKSPEAVDGALSKISAAPGNPRLWINTMWDVLSAGHSDSASLTDPEAAWGWWIGKGATMIQTDTGAELVLYLERTGRHTL